MRLLNVDSLDFEEFYENEAPNYYILSHRWGEKEVSFRDFSKRKNTEWRGYRKIIRFCEWTKCHSEQVKWIWIDTCCIDKRSSAELSEAINSMYRWYANAMACVVYLADVENGQLTLAGGSRPLESSDWFTRGWTLQELLAPKHLIFCDVHWRIFGHVCDLNSSAFSLADPVDRSLCPHDEQVYGVELSRHLSKITTIPANCLRNSEHIKSMSIAQKMSWASERKTSRIEDEAYCLLGLFGVNMPLIYGEGRNAFFRLQQEIIKTSSDQSIFAWMGDNENSHSMWLQVAPLFATRPAAFVNMENVTRLRGHGSSGYIRPRPFTLTNLGLEMRVDMYPMIVNDVNDIDTFFVYLNCTSGKKPGASNNAEPGNEYYGLVLTRMDESLGENRFSRLWLGDIITAHFPDDRAQERLIYIDAVGGATGSGFVRNSLRYLGDSTTVTGGGQPVRKPVIAGPPVGAADVKMDKISNVQEPEHS